MGQVRLITNFDDLQAIASDWRMLEGVKLMRSWEFQRCWIQNFATTDALRILVSERNGRVDGILPLIEEKRLLTGRTLVNVGSGKACLDDLGIIAAPDVELDVARDFAQYLLRAREVHWDYLSLEGIRTSDLAMNAFAEVFSRNCSDAVERRSDESCWALELQPDQEGHHAWSKRLRKLMRKARDEEARGDLQWRIASNLEDALSELDVMQSIHQARWQDRGIDGCFSNARFARFTRELVRENFAAGRSVIAILRWRGVPAAGSICFLGSDTLYAYLASMSPEFSEEKPGWKLNGYLADYAIQRGCRWLDFMRGDEEYKQRLAATPASQERWMIASPQFWGRVHRTLYRTARDIKHFIAPPAASQPMQDAAANSSAIYE